MLDVLWRSDELGANCCGPFEQDAKPSLKIPHYLWSLALVQGKRPAEAESQLAVELQDDYGTHLLHS